jgi:hypothetical protein
VGGAKKTNPDAELLPTASNALATMVRAGVQAVKTAVLQTSRQ